MESRRTRAPPVCLRGEHKSERRTRKEFIGDDSRVCILPVKDRGRQAHAAASRRRLSQHPLRIKDLISLPDMEVHGRRAD